MFVLTKFNQANMRLPDETMKIETARRGLRASNLMRGSVLTQTL